MSIIGWIVLGIIIGFVASRVAHKKGRGIIPDIILGIAGSIVGGILFVELTAESVSRVNLHSLLAAIMRFSTTRIRRAGCPCISFRPS